MFLKIIPVTFSLALFDIEFSSVLSTFVSPGRLRVQNRLFDLFINNINHHDISAMKESADNYVLRSLLPDTSM